MKFNKKGIGPVFGIILFVLLIFGLILVWNYFHTKAGNQFNVDDLLASSKPIGEVVGVSSMNWLSYIFGAVPDLLIQATSEIGAVVVIVLVWLILALMFGDILSLFGTFGTVKTGPVTNQIEWSPVAWAVGVALAVIMANFKVVMLIASMGMFVAGSFGVVAAVLGVVTPFIVYIAVHFLFLSNLKHLLKRNRDMVKYNQGITDVKQGITGAKEFAKAVRS